MQNECGSKEIGKARTFVKWQLKIPVSESILKGAKKWRCQTGEAVPQKVVCKYGAAVEGVHLGQMYHDYHGQLMLSKMRRCKMNAVK